MKMFSVDLSAAPFVLHVWSGKPSLDDVTRLRECLEWEAEQREALYVFVDLRAGELPDTKTLRELGYAFRDYEGKRKTAVLIVVVDNWLVVSALNVIRWFAPHRFPEIFVRTGGDAVDAAVDFLREQDAPPLPDAVKAKLIAPQRATRPSVSP